MLASPPVMAHQLPSCANRQPGMSTDFPWTSGDGPLTSINYSRMIHDSRCISTNPFVTRWRTMDIRQSNIFIGKHLCTFRFFKVSTCNLFNIEIITEIMPGRFACFGRLQNDVFLPMPLDPSLLACCCLFGYCSTNVA